MLSSTDRRSHRRNSSDVIVKDSSENEKIPGTTATTSMQHSIMFSSCMTAAIDDDDETDTKDREIEACLHGNRYDVVDLNHLRQLCLSKGGLKSNRWRKQAWPKLLASHHVLWESERASNSSFSRAALLSPWSGTASTSNESTSTTVSGSSLSTNSTSNLNHPSHADLQRIKYLVKRTKWSKQRMSRSPKTFDELLGQIIDQNDDEGQVPQASTPTSSSSDPSISITNSSNKGSPLGTLVEDVQIPPTPTSLDYSPSPVAKSRSKVTFALPDLPIEPNDVAITVEQPRPHDRKRTRKVLKNPVLVNLEKEERNVLRKLMMHLKRVDGNFCLFDGLQNLLTVLWIVIETPSLTSVVSQQLVQYSWKLNQPKALEALSRQAATLQWRGNFDKTSNSDFFMQLLQCWDPTLYYHLRKVGYQQTPHCILHSWVPTWFAQDLREIQVLLRLWDVFLVSHPTTVVYFSAALAIHFRKVLLKASQQSVLQAILENLPSDGLEKYHSEFVEKILETTFHGLSSYPPPMNRAEMPSWAFAATAPTDYKVLKGIQRIREGNERERLERLQLAEKSTGGVPTTLTVQTKGLQVDMSEDDDLMATPTNSPTSSDPLQAGLVSTPVLLSLSEVDREKAVTLWNQYPTVAVAMGVPTPEGAFKGPRPKERRQETSFLSKLNRVVIILILVVAVARMFLPGLFVSTGDMNPKVVVQSGLSTETSANILPVSLNLDAFESNDVMSTPKEPKAGNLQFDQALPAWNFSQDIDQQCADDENTQVLAPMDLVGAGMLEHETTLEGETKVVEAKTKSNLGSMRSKESLSRARMGKRQRLPDGTMNPSQRAISVLRNKPVTTMPMAENSPAEDKSAERDSRIAQVAHQITQGAAKGKEFAASKFKDGSKALDRGKMAILSTSARAGSFTRKMHSALSRKFVNNKTEMTQAVHKAAEFSGRKLRHGMEASQQGLDAFRDRSQNIGKNLHQKSIKIGKTFVSEISGASRQGLDTLGNRSRIIRENLHRSSKNGKKLMKELSDVSLQGLGVVRNRSLVIRECVQAQSSKIGKKVAEDISVASKKVSSSLRDMSRKLEELRIKMKDDSEEALSRDDAGKLLVQTAAIRFAAMDDAREMILSSVSRRESPEPEDRMDDEEFRKIFVNTAGVRLTGLTDSRATVKDAVSSLLDGRGGKIKSALVSFGRRFR